MKIPGLVGAANYPGLVVRRREDQSASENKNGQNKGGENKNSENNAGDHSESDHSSKNENKTKSGNENSSLDFNTLGKALESFQIELETQAKGLQASLEGQGPGLKVILKGDDGRIVRQFSGEEFLRMRELSVMESRIRGKILDQKLSKSLSLRVMSVLIVSDLHIRGPSDPLYSSLLSLLRDRAATGDTVVLAGDLFDLFVGNKKYF